MGEAMKVSYTIEKWDDFRRNLMIDIDDEAVFDVYDGEPEDNNLYRNFNDCFKVVDLIRMAYEAGKRGEELEVEELVSDN